MYILHIKDVLSLGNYIIIIADGIVAVTKAGSDGPDIRIVIEHCSNNRKQLE